VSNLRISTPVDVHIAFGDIWLESAQQIEWREEVTRRPMFGVLSPLYRDVTKGRLQVSGTLGVYHDNLGSFTRTLMGEVNRKVAGPPSVRRATNQANQLIQSVLDSRSSSEAAAIIMALNEQRFVSVGGRGDTEGTFASILKALEGSFVNLDSTPRTPTNYNYMPAIDVELLERIKNVDMDIIYVDPIGGDDLPTGERFVDIRFTGRVKGFSNAPRQSGQPIMEFFSFVAKKVTVADRTSNAPPRQLTDLEEASEKATTSTSGATTLDRDENRTGIDK